MTLTKDFMNQLDALKQFTTVVADTGDFHQIAQFKPRDATTNPSLILKAVQKSEYAPLLQEVVSAHPGAAVDVLTDHLLVRFGVAILEHVPGRVSTEVDARLSFDTAGTIERARRIMALYAAQSVERERVLIKIAATWEGIQAAAQLEREGIRCNLTLVFALCQALACGSVGVQLISPFVGRIYDWHKKAAGTAWNEAERSGANDPGVQSVTAIYNCFKRHGIATEVMGASFRNVGQILALAGCDLLTISPDLLSQMEGSSVPVVQALSAKAASSMSMDVPNYTEATFKLALNNDAMTSEKLAEGIRAFCADSVKLDNMLR